MNEERLKEIAARVEAATPEQTRVLQSVIESVEKMLSADDAPSMFCLGRALRRILPFLKKYEVARSDIPFLLAEIKRLTAERDAAVRWADRLCRKMLAYNDDGYQEPYDIADEYHEWKAMVAP
jgi:uncharacterized protein (UPF0216 family)